MDASFPCDRSCRICQVARRPRRGLVKKKPRRMSEGFGEESEVSPRSAKGGFDGSNCLSLCHEAFQANRIKHVVLVAYQRPSLFEGRLGCDFGGLRCGHVTDGQLIVVFHMIMRGCTSSAYWFPPCRWSFSSVQRARSLSKRQNQPFRYGFGS